MKKLIFVLIAIATTSLISYSQCTPDPNVNSDGIFPSDPNDIPCVERGVSYSTTLTIKLPASFSGVTLDNLTLANLTGLPNGLSYFCTPANCVFAGGGAYCIEIAGNTTDPAGNYPLGIIASVTVTIPVVGSQTLGPMDINDLLAQSPVPIPITIPSYSLDVIEPGNPCRGVSTSLSASVSGNTEICSGQSTTLSVVSQNSTGVVSFLWSTTETTSSITVSAAGTYTVTVTDDIDSSQASVTVTEIGAPTSSFTLTQNNATVSVTDAATGIVDVGTWDFGDGTSSTAQSPAPHTYASNGTYTITQIVENSCGSDTSEQTVNITGVFIEGLGKNASIEVYPNPNNGQFELNLRGIDNDANFQINVFDLAGKIVYNDQIQSESGVIQRTINLDQVARGIYNLKIFSKEGTATRKLLVY